VIIFGPTDNSQIISFDLSWQYAFRSSRVRDLGVLLWIFKPWKTHFFCNRRKTLKLFINFVCCLKSNLS